MHMVCYSRSDGTAPEQTAQSCKAGGVPLEKRGLPRENHGKLKPNAFLTRN